MRFFFYGTLMDEAVRRAVLGPAAGGLTLRPATLEGWRRAAVRGRHYPIAVPAAGRSVQGLLADGVNTSALRRLDRFEGPEYHRIPLDVRAAHGLVRGAWTYVAIDTAVAATRDWNFDQWRRRHRDAFLRRLATDRAARTSAGGRNVSGTY